MKDAASKKQERCEAPRSERESEERMRYKMLGRSVLLGTCAAAELQSATSVVEKLAYGRGSDMNFVEYAKPKELCVLSL